MQDLSLTSPAFNNQDYIPIMYTADGDNVSPPLEINSVNEEAASLVLIMDDPDAATDPDGPGQVFDHWVLFNIGPGVTHILENQVPIDATVGLNGMGQSIYTGPAPPNGTHHYQFRLYELSDRLDNLTKDTSKDDVLKAIKNLTLRQTLLVGLYQRQNR